MAMVPDTFVPSVSTSPIGVSPLSAQPVRPMQNHAPEQMQQAGQATQRLGEEVNNIGERIQNQLDDSMAKQAETKFLNSAMQIANGDGQNPGYLHTLGQDAINGLPDAQKALAQAKQAGLDGLSNDFQKSMYNRVANQHLISFGAQFSDHHFQQGTQYYGEASINRAQAHAAIASNSGTSYGQVDADGNATGDFLKHTQIAEQETLDAVQRMKGAPAGSGVANDALLKLHTQIGVGVLSQMMDAPQDQRPSYSRVQQVYDDMKEKGWLTLQAQDSLGKMVKSYSDGEIIRVATNNALSAAQRSKDGQGKGMDYSATPIKGATVSSSGFDPERGNVIVSVPKGSNIQAPADGKVTQVGTDAEGTFSVGIEHADGSTSRFTGLQAANVKVGDAVQSGDSIATSGTIADSNKPSVLWSLTDAKGQKVDPTRVGASPVDITKITDENVLATALGNMRKQITDPELQQKATSEMESIVRHNQQMDGAAKRQVLQQATDAFYNYANTHNGNYNVNSIPASLRGQIPPESLNRFIELSQNGPPKEDHTDTLAGFILNQDTLTVANVQAARPNLTNGSYLTLLQKAKNLEDNPKGVIEADSVQKRISFYAEQAGLPLTGAKMTPDQKATATQFNFKIVQDIDALKAQNHGKATAEQVDKVIQQELVQRTLSKPVIKWYDPFGFGNHSEDTKIFEFQKPQGTAHIYKGSDGNLHYVDDKGNSLGVAK